MILFDDDIFQKPFYNFVKYYRKIINYIYGYQGLKEEDDFILSLSNDFKPFNLSLVDIDNLYKNNCKKFSRALKRINYIMDNFNYVYFCTFTFSDDYILKYDKCFKYFKNHYLKDFCYLGNIDFGSINDRVHYHCVIGSDYKVNKDILKWKYGFYDLKLCNKNSKAISKYIVKLSYHSFKKCHKLIYSRINKN